MKKKFILISIILISFGISLLIYSVYQDKKLQHTNEELLEEFFDNYDDSVEVQEQAPVENTSNNQKIQSNVNYLAVIEIPNISLNTGIVMSDSNYNTMNKHVSIYPTSDMPNIDNGNFILFAHNGSSRVSYFRNIYKLDVNDKIYIYYNNQKYTYKVIKNYDVSMYNSTPLNRIDNKTIITLITCKSGSNKYRTIIVGELVE